MLIVITGTPGAGKSTIAKAVGKALAWKVLNESEFCRKHKIGRIDKESKELVVPLKELGKKLKAEAKKHKNLIVEGHLLCEIKLPARLAFVLRASLKVLEERLWEKAYDELKILDNVFCEQTSYCLKKAVKNYGKSRVLEVKNEKGIKESAGKIVKEIKKRERAGK
jgi:adenylate kinase